jgi:alkylresorcinol/alkylpyrone synthase
VRIAAVGTAFPPHYYDQQALLAAVRARFSEQGAASFDRLARFHRNVLVGGRHLALPLEQYASLATWGEANDAWIRVAQEVGEAAIRQALDRAGLAPQDIDALYFVSITGIATPSIDARLMNRLGFHPGVRRVPIFGLGCAAGAAGLARAADDVRAHPEEIALLVAVELCSLTLQSEDFSPANLIASGLFGDGAAAVVVAGERARVRHGGGPAVVASRSVFYPDSEDVMGWKISEKGFSVILSAEIPDIVRRRLRGDVDAFLGEQGVARGEVARWICHPGGPRVLEAMEAALEIPAGGLEATWRSLAEVGNLSSVSVLLVLEETLAGPPPAPGAPGVVLAMGPGFCSEMVLLRW